MRRPSDMGDGNWCPTEGHGRMIRISGGRQWCPHQDHDKSGVTAFYETDGVTPSRGMGPDAPVPVKPKRGEA